MISHFNEIGSFQLNSNYSLDFEIYINDPLFDNNDNEYGQIKLHNYINMNH